MNPVAKEINDILMHYGVSIDDGAPGRGSGRYPKGSGENPYQHVDDFLTRYRSLEAKGYSETAIAEEMGIKSTEKLRIQKQAAVNDEKYRRYVRYQELRDEGKTWGEIAEIMGDPGESTPREALKHPERFERAKAGRVTAEYLKQVLTDNPGKAIDVGERSNELVGVSEMKLKEALYLLEQEGYHVYTNYKVRNQTNPDVNTTFTLLTTPDVEFKDLYHDKNNNGLPIDIAMINETKDKILTDSGNKIEPAFRYPQSLDSKRLQVVYAEDGGEAKDGLVELRRGVNDISLNGSNYAQVRILVDGTHYIKGMAVYADDLPPGIDIRFNTKKTKDIPVMTDNPKDDTVLKAIKTDDPMNPFNSLIKEKGGQYNYIGEDGKEHMSLINKRADQGDWTDWADKLPSQFLAKQPVKLIRQQLDISLKDKEDQLNDILSITNPEIKRDRLLSFALECDGASVDLKAAPLPRQKWHVILPVPSMPENEIFAP